MATYTRVHANWLNDEAGGTEADADAFNTIEAGIAAIYTLVNAAGELIYATAADTLERLGAGTSTQLLHGGTTPSWSQIVNADVGAAAAIAYSKLNLALGIVNADINASAAIAYAKLALTNSLVYADLAQTAWTSYVPAWTSTGTAPAIGDGTLTGKSVRLGNFVAFVVNMTLGGTSTAGTGTYSWSLPVAAAASILSGHPLGGSGRVIDASPSAGYTGFVGRGATDTTVRIIFADDVGTGADSPASATLPITPASGDQWVLAGFYEAA